MRLFIAEKPSMGREISKYLTGRAQSRNGYIVHGDDVVTWAFGHVLQQAEPGDYNGRYKKWNMQDLPIIPQEWKLLITKSSAEQFQLIKSLIEKADVIVNAGDPDREGQLLIDEILDYVNNQKPVQRILLNALDEKSVKMALSDLRDNRDFFNLKQSALARARADWLMGMNLSRAFTLAARNKGHEVTFPIGRVKTPTLALVVRREKELENFVPVEYFTIRAHYEHLSGAFVAHWEPKELQRGLDAEGRLLSREIAEELVQRFLNQPEGKVVKREKVRKKESQRLPLSLSTLQVLAGKAYGYDPQTVLDTAQKLYEKKLTSYPRSDCDFLPENQYKDRSQILQNLGATGDAVLAEWVQNAKENIKSRAWNDKKITAHHAIIPTTVLCKINTLSEIEQRIYRLIAQAYIAQFYEIHEYEQTKIIIDQGGETFVARGRVVVSMGWKELYRKVEHKQIENNEDENSQEGNEQHELPALKKGDVVIGKHYDVESKTTKPPSRFTAATLLQAMKEIHKYVKNEALKKQLKDVAGIGTEATRASIIKELIDRKFLLETGKKKILQPTDTAYLLIDALPESLVYPDETAVWERRLALMSEGKDNIKDFLSDQERFLRELIKQAVTQNIPNSVSCPACGKGHLLQRKGKYGEFYGCSCYPNCTYTEKIKQDFGKGQKSEYKCPRCEKGYFVKHVQGTRISWICSEYPTCHTQCADTEGVPSIYGGKQNHKR